MAEEATIHRIYQGRATHLWRRVNQEWVQTDSQMGLVWLHHALFQSAVNYYTVALAAMATDPDSAAGRLRQQMASCWDDYSIDGCQRPGLRKSLQPFIGDFSSLDKAASFILDGIGCPSEVLQRALECIIGSISGDGAVQQSSKEYLPRLTSPKFKGKYGKDKELKEIAFHRLSERIHAEDSDSEWLNILTSLRFEWFANAATGELVGQKLRDKLREAVKSVGEEDPEIKKEEDRLMSLVDSLPDVPGIPAYAGGSVNKKPIQQRFFRFLIVSMLEKSELTFRSLKRSFPVPKKSKKPRINSADAHYDDADPVKLARGSRGYIFKAFTSLPAWNASPVRSGTYSKFDIHALAEAFKTLNQFAKKQAERDHERSTYEVGLRWLVDGVKLPSSQEQIPEEWRGEDAEVPGTLHNDPRTDLVKQLLEADLAVANELTDGLTVPYFLRDRTLRGSHEVFEAWNKAFHANHVPDMGKLIEIWNSHQTRHPDDSGSASLFRALTAKKYWPIWKDPDENEMTIRNQNGWTTDLLGTYAMALGFKERIGELNTPVRFTPADPEFSKRLYLASEVGIRFPPSNTEIVNQVDGKQKRRTKGFDFPSETNPQQVIFSIAVQKETGWTFEEICLEFSAPRLWRDSLLGKEPCWLPPMLKPLIKEQAPSFDFSDAAAMQLMPDRRQGSPRILLNFPIKLNVDEIRKAYSANGRWGQRQFNGTTDSRIHLHWPETTKLSKSTRKSDWWESNESWRVLSVDLGQRTAGAFSRIRVDAEDHPCEHGKGWHLGQAGDHNWNAHLEQTGLLRLPGENPLVWDGISKKWIREPYGPDGRKPDSHETLEAEQILSSLPAHGLNPSELHSMSFSRQNSYLLVAVRRAQSWFSRVHRWVWMLDNSLASKALSEVQSYVTTHPNLIPSEDINLDTLPGLLRSKIPELESLIPRSLLHITQRIMPLRHYEWSWSEHPTTPNCHQLQWIPRSYPRKPIKVRGQMGLSFDRITQIEELRVRWQSINRTLQRSPGQKPPSGRKLRENPIPDPCPALLEKLDIMKRQRVNQTAHMIVAEALGIELKAPSNPPNKLAHDIHGEYQAVRPPVAFVVMEDLSRYRTSQSRGSAENSRLMKWCHRAVLDKVKMLCEPLGIQVLEVNAAYSSRFCSKTRVPGFRAVEVTLADMSRFPWSARRNRGNADSNANRGLESETVELVFQQLSEAEALRRGKRPRTLLLPQSGGNLFVPINDWPAVTRKSAHGPISVKPHGIQQADINAAINIGLKAIAGPFADSIHLRVRLNWDEDHWTTRGKTDGNLIEKARFRDGLTVNDFAPKDGKSSMMGFWDVGNLSRFDFGFIKGSKVTSGKSLWGPIKNELCWKRIKEINLERIRSWKNDEIPF